MFLLGLVIAFAIVALAEAISPQFLSSGVNTVAVKNTGAHRLSASVVVFIVLLAVVFFLSVLLHLVCRCFVRCSRIRRSGIGSSSSSSSSASANANASILRGQLQQLFNLHDSGVEQAFIDALPVFFYRSVQGLKDAADCAVCLCEFHGDDRLRLLPICSHAFHIHCIDTWLLSHSTCPLCRRSLIPDPIATHGLQANADRDGNPPDVCRSVSDQALAMDAAAADEGSENAELQSNQSSSQKRSALVSVRLGRVCPMAVADAAAAAGVMENAVGTNSSCSGRRSFSMGSYEYFIYRSNLQVVAAPMPVPRRWENRKLLLLPPVPGHKTALSDFTPHSCAAEDPPPAFSEELSLASSCFCPRDPSAYAKQHKASDGEVGKMKQQQQQQQQQAVSAGVGSAEAKPMHSRVYEANSMECSRRFLIARKTLHWLMGRERRFVYPAVNP